MREQLANRNIRKKNCNLSYWRCNPYFTPSKLFWLDHKPTRDFYLIKGFPRHQFIVSFTFDALDFEYYKSLILYI